MLLDDNYTPFDEVSDLKRKVKEPFIGDDSQAEKFQLFNPYIKRGYRINFNTHSKIARTLFMIHNESINIWSHIIGAIIFSYILINGVINLEPIDIYNQIVALNNLNSTE